MKMVTPQPVSVMSDTNVLIDPYGVVFDAKTNQPVAGATVTLLDANGKPAENVAYKLDETTGTSCYSCKAGNR